MRRGADQAADPASRTVLKCEADHTAGRAGTATRSRCGLPRIVYYSAEFRPDRKDHKGFAMAPKIPDETIRAFSRTLYQEGLRYGFGQLDFVRLINVLMDLAAGDSAAPAPVEDGHKAPVLSYDEFKVDAFPLSSPRIRIRPADAKADVELLERWMQDDYGRHFLTSCATAQRMKVPALLGNPANEIGIVTLVDGTPIGSVAFLDLDATQARAELRKLIGVSDARGQGYAEEATALWIKYGCERLIKLNESIGFRVEGVLQDEVRIGRSRHDVLRMGLTAERFREYLFSR
jgi:RimJ/RimL family protein N-acetyltransferase